MSCDPVRRQALDILLQVADGERLDPLLDRGLGELSDPRAAAFLAGLVRGTLQWQGRYDHVIAHFSRKRPPRDPVLVTILRLSLHQMLGQDGVPVYAAIHQAGELCRVRAGRRKVGFINGMLQSVRRQVLTESADPAAREAGLRALFADIAADRPRWLAAWYSLPPWLVTRWVKNFGAEEAERICAWINAPVAMQLHVLGDYPLAEARTELAAAGIETEVADGPGTLSVSGHPGRTRLRSCLERMPHLIVQDIAVQQATRWLAEAVPADGPVLDMCAAPGGKTAHLRAVRPTLAPLIAMDNRRERMGLLRDTVERTSPGTVRLVMADGQYPPFAAGTFDCILLDGPCSGTGVLRHHPDGRWRLRAGTPAAKARQLLRLASEACELLAPGGLLLYATCSLEPEENDQVIASLMKRRPEMAPAPDEQGKWRRQWLPHQVQGDGFFAVRLRRNDTSPQGCAT